MSTTFMRPRRFIAHAVLALSFVGPAFAATYTQDFSAAPSSWTVFDDSSLVTESFIVSGGAYTNTQGAGMNAPYRSVAYYNGATWSTNYTFTAKLNSDYESDGNRVGVVWNLQDSSNYYEVSVAMRTYTNTTPRTIVNTGGATLFKVTGGSHTPIATFTATGVPWPENDTFFPVEVTRWTRTVSGAPVTTTRVSVGGVLAFKRDDLNAYTTGRVGVFAQYNTGRFDDVKVVDAVPLFKSGFESGVTNTGPTCIGTTAPTQFEDIAGADITGYHWDDDLSFWGPNKAAVFNTAVSCSYTYTDYININISPETAGPTGTTSNVLKNTVNKWHQPTTADEPRAGVNYVFDTLSTNGTSYYIRRYLKYPADMLTKMNNGSWFAQHEYKTGCSAPLPGRLAIYWRQDGQDPNKVSYYQLARDLNNNCSGLSGPVWAIPCTPSIGGNCPAMPVGSWFYDEFYVSYPTNGVGGLVQYAINGQWVFNEPIPAGNELPSMPNRVKLTPGYMNTNGIEVLVDDLEMWTAPPCATFPCQAPPDHVQ